jgi:hypothetical protein
MVAFILRLVGFFTLLLVAAAETTDPDIVWALAPYRRVEDAACYNTSVKTILQPLPPPTPPCVDLEVEVFKVVGSQAWDLLPITILERYEDRVLFAVAQTWKDAPICAVMTDLQVPGTEEQMCYREQAVRPGEFATYEAACVDGWANVTIYVHFQNFHPTLDDAVIPERCKANDAPGRKVSYDFQLPCSSDSFNYCVIPPAPDCSDGLNKVIAVDDFTTADNWIMGDVWYDDLGNSMLGPFGDATTEMVRTFVVPNDANLLHLTFGWFQLGDWGDTDIFHVRVGNQYMKLRGVVDGILTSQYLDVQVTVVNVLEDNHFAASMQIPSRWFQSGRVTVGFDFHTENNGAQATVDRFRLTAVCSM